MNVALKKIAIRWLVIEVIVMLSTLIITPFILGSIKPLKPLNQIVNQDISIKLSVNTKLALKKADVKKAQQTVSSIEKSSIINKKTNVNKTTAATEKTKIIEKKPTEKPVDQDNGKRSIQPIGKTIIITNPGEVETPTLIQ